MNRSDVLQILILMSALGVAPVLSGCGSGPRTPGGLGAERDGVGDAAAVGAESGATAASEEALADSELGRLDPISLERDPRPSSIEEEASLNRLFALDALAAEFTRAIQDGLDDNGQITAKLRDVEREISWRRESLGKDRIDQARLLRLERLKRLPIVLR